MRNFKAFRDEKVVHPNQTDPPLPEARMVESRVTTRTKASNFDSLVNSVVPPHENRMRRSSETAATSRSMVAMRGSLNLKKEEESKPIMPEDIAKINKQNQELKMMGLSEEMRNALKQVQRYDSMTYAREMERLCKEAVEQEKVRLKKVQNSVKEMRMKTYDNELTVNVISNQLRLVIDSNNQLTELRKIKELYDREERRKKELQFRSERQAKTREIHLQNVQARLDEIVGRIEASLSSKDYEKAAIIISNEYMRKYQKEEFAAEKTYYYQLILQILQDNTAYDKCLDETGKILWTLSMADLNATDACLRSLNANHKEFNYLQTKYNGDKVTAGKQMLSILSHLEKFNDHIIQYLENVKLLEKEKSKPDNTKFVANRFEGELDKINRLLDEERKKSAVMYNELEKKKFKIEGMEKSLEELEAFKKNRRDFDIKMSQITAKVNEGKDWDKQLDILRKDKVLGKEKPFVEIINFGDMIHRTYMHKIEKEVERMMKIFDDVAVIFRKPQLTHEMRFNDLARVLEAPCKKDPHLTDLHRHLEGLMLTIIKRTKEDAEEKRMRKLEKQFLNVEGELKEEKKKTRKLSEQISELVYEKLADDNSFCGSPKDSNGDRSQSRTPVRSRRGSIDIATPPVRSRRGSIDMAIPPSGSRSRRGSIDMATPPVGTRSRRGSIDMGSNQGNQASDNDLVGKIEVVLNRTSAILFQDTPNSMEFRLKEVENLFTKTVKKNPKYKKILEVLVDWIEYVVNKLSLMPAGGQ